MGVRTAIAAAALCLWSFGFTGLAEAAKVTTSAAAEQKHEFVLGNLVFTLFHEVGHALVSEFELPVLGREEDAVDRLATYLLTPEGDEDEDSDSSTILIDAINGWFVSSARTELDEIEWWGEHGPDQQRAYQIACLLYGSDPAKFRSLAEEVELPKERRASCPAEHESNEASWLKVLEAHVLGDGEKPSAKVRVSYGSPGAYRAERDLLKESEIVETIAGELSETFRLPRPLRIRAKSCGEANAFWNSDEAQIEICYELLREYGDLFEEADR